MQALKREKRESRDLCVREKSSTKDLVGGLSRSHGTPSRDQNQRIYLQGFFHFFFLLLYTNLLFIHILNSPVHEISAMIDAAETSSTHES